MTETNKIRVAIVGGGLGGTVLMNGLMTYDHLDVHMYEAKDTFKERGASVGLAVNAQRALKCMGLQSVMDKTGAVPVNGARCIVGEGPDQGKLVINKMGDLLTVHRPNLLRELIDKLPQDRLHAKKKATHIEDRTLTFDDGTTASADVIVGADGIHSMIRRYVLGKGNPGVEPVAAGIFDFRTVVPFETALSKIGSENLRPEQPLQTIYAGHGMLIFFDYINDGKEISIFGAGLAPSGWSDDKQWKKKVPLSWLSEQYKAWPDSVKEMVRLCCDSQEEVPLFTEWESGITSNLVSGSVCIMGDAAHATTPWQGAGLGQAIEDAMILKTILGECKSVGRVEIGLKIFDEVMRPRGRRVIESSRVMAGLLTGQKGLNAEFLNREMTPMWDFIYNWDTEAVAADVRKRTRESLISPV